jgi:flagellar hook-length control protein FliK
VVRPLRLAPDGSYELSLRMAPEQLGEVSVQVQLHQGRIHLVLHAADEQARQALADAAPALRAELEASGFNSASLDIGQGPGSEGSGRTAQERDGSSRRGPNAGGGAENRPLTSANAASKKSEKNSSGSLDLRL